MLIKNPGFTVVAVLSLAFGIGANSAIFSVLDATLLRKRPYPKDSERIYRVLVMDMKNRLYFGGPLTLTNYFYWRDQNQVFDQLAAHVHGNFNVIGGGKPESFSGEYVSANFFFLMGVQAARGRTFLLEENRPDRAQVVVLSHGLWKRCFGADPRVIGKLVTLN